MVCPIVEANGSEGSYSNDNNESHCNTNEQIQAKPLHWFFLESHTAWIWIELALSLFDFTISNTAQNRRYLVWILFIQY
jgi:hypothetical protein